MKLSVIVTIFNAEKYLQDSLDSLFGQTFKDFETILVNDGSSDGSRDILLRHFHQYPNVRLLENVHNVGIPISRNRALLEAQGEYIAIHDADDISLPQRFEKETNYLDLHPEVDVVGSHAYKINFTGTLLGMLSYPPQTTDEAFRIIKNFKLNPIVDPSCMFRKSVVLDMGGYSMDPSVQTALDFHLWCRMLSQGCKLYNFQEPLIKYRINPDGVTRTQHDKMVKATDDIVSSFNRRNFNKIVLRSSLFQQESYTEIEKV